MQEHARILERGAPDPASISGEDARALIAARPADRRSVRAVQRGGAEGIRTPDPFHAITARVPVTGCVARGHSHVGRPSSTLIRGGCYSFRYTATIAPAALSHALALREAPDLIAISRTS